MAKKLFVTGLVGTALTALCCLLALIVVLSGIRAAPDLAGWLELLLLPSLGVFGAMLVISLFLRRYS